MNTRDDNREKNIYYYETENDTDDDGDTRTVVSSDNDTIGSENYMEDFDNKSERDFTEDIVIPDENGAMEEVSDDMLFDMSDEKEIPDNLTNSQEELYNSSLLIQYQQDENGKLSMPYGIYNECRKTLDGNSVCSQTELTNDKDAMDTKEDVIDTPEAVLDVPEAVLDVPEAVLDVPEAVIDTPEAVLDAPEAVLDVPEAVLDVKDIAVLAIDEKQKSSDLEYTPQKGNDIRRRDRRTAKKTSRKKFNYTKKRRGEIHIDVSKKRGSRNKRRNSKKKMTRRK